MVDNNNPIGYRVRWIDFRKKRRPVFMQSKNGPCPLLALANVFSLVGRLASLSMETSFMLHEDLLQLFESSLRSLPNFNSLTFPIVKDHLPNLARGLLLDPKFSLPLKDPT